MPKEEIERRNAPRPTPPQTPRAGVPDEETYDYTNSLRTRITDYAYALMDRIDADGGPVTADGNAHPLLEFVAMLVDSGTGLRRLSLERRLGGEIMSFRARRPV